jgi:hypothetical protein
MTENVTMLFQSHFNRNRKLPSYKKYKCSVVESFDKILHISSNRPSSCPSANMIDVRIKEVENNQNIDFNDYRCILISHIHHRDIENDILGDKLADYVDRGGNVVLCMFSNTSSGDKYPAGRFTSYHPFKLDRDRYISRNDTVDICMKNHPMMKNVNTLKYIDRPTIQGDIQEGRRVDIEVVGKWKKDGGNMIGIRYDKRGLIVSIGCVCSDMYTKGDIYPLLKNVVRYRKYRGKKRSNK